MTHDEEMATQAMLKIHSAIGALRDAAITAKALHMHLLSDEQKKIVESCCFFGYANVPPPNKPYESGDGLAWKFEKFLVQQTSTSSK